MQYQLVRFKIEVDLDDAALVRDGIGAVAGGRYVQRGMPRVVLPRHGAQADFTDYLQPLVHGFERGLQLLEVEGGPLGGGAGCLHEF